jgi:membrane protease YdiL (CAAX protease family)
VQNYGLNNNLDTYKAGGTFYSTRGLAFILIFIFLFQLIFYFFSIYTAGLFFHLSFQEVMNLLNEPDGTATAINIARYTNVISFTGTMFLPALLFSVINGTSIIEIGGLKVLPKLNILFVSGLLLALAIPLVDYLTALIHAIDLPLWLRHYADHFEHTRNENLSTILDMQRPIELIFCLFAIGLLPAVFEEIMFRGILMKIFKNITGKVNTSIFLQAFVFTVLHFSVFEFPGIFLMGILFGIIAHRTGTIVYGIVMHFAFNAISIIISWLNQVEFRKSGVYGEFGSFEFNTFTAVIGFLGLIVLIGLLRRVTPKNKDE